MGVVIEHFAGAFPVWLSPVQAVVIPVADRHLDYAREVQEKLGRAAICASRSTTRRTACRKRSGTNSRQKIPYLLIVGDREAEEGTVNVRRRGEKQQEEMSLDSFAESVREQIRSRT